MDEQRAADAKAGKSRSFVAIVSDLQRQEGDDRCPELGPDLLLVQAYHSRLGRDGNGCVPGTEMQWLWDREGIADAGQQDAYLLLWRAMESEANKVQAERIEEIRRNTPRTT